MHSTQHRFWKAHLGLTNVPKAWKKADKQWMDDCLCAFGDSDLLRKRLDAKGMKWGCYECGGDGPFRNV